MPVSKEDTLEALKHKIDEHGDLPVFSASVNRICCVSSDPDADVMSLSQEVLKDANLSVKLLRLANSPYYSRGSAKVGVVSRAIIVLGFETVKSLSLTMKFIESFQAQHPSIDMDRLLVRSYLTASFVRDLAMNLGIKDVEESYTCALLHDLGEIAVATYLPDKFIEIESLNKQGGKTSTANEKSVLGTSMSDIGKALAANWEFSPRVVSTIDNETPKISGVITKPNELNKVMAKLGSSLISALYNDNPADQSNMQEMMSNLAKATGMRAAAIESSLSDSFKMSCDLAKTYGLSAKKLMPVVADTGDVNRDKLASQLSFYVSNQVQVKAPNTANATDVVQTNSESSNVLASDSLTSQKCTEADQVDFELQLQYVQEITALITDASKLNTVLLKVLEGMHVAAGFSRVVLCLLSVDRKSFAGRIAIGTDKDLMKDYFTRPINARSELFSRVIFEDVDILVEDSHDQRWENILPAKFHARIATNSFVVAPLKSGLKTLGFVYADKSTSKHPVSAEQYRAFIQFIAQTRLAFQTCR